MKKSAYSLYYFYFWWLSSAQKYDIVIKGGHVIDPKNNIDAIMDVAISDGKNCSGCKKY